MGSCFPLFRSIARCRSFIVFKLRWTSLSSSVVEPSLADVPLVSSRSASSSSGSKLRCFDCTAFVVVSSSPSETFPSDCSTCTVQHRPPATVATHLPLVSARLSRAHTRSYTLLLNDRPKSRIACRWWFSLCLYLCDLHSVRQVVSSRLSTRVLFVQI